MADTNNFTPTAANILSSLNIKGASATGGTLAAGKVPVLNSEGKLDASFMPVHEIITELDIKSLTDIAYVDYDTGRGDQSYVPSGSIAHPFRDLTEAAEAGFSSFVLTPGDYGSSNVILYTNSTSINIICPGTAKFSSLTVSGYSQGAVITLYNISVTSTLSVNESAASTVVFTGTSDINKLKGRESISGGISTWFVEEAKIGPTANVKEFQYTESVSYLAGSSRVSNDSAKVRGETVTDAIDRLYDHHIRIPVFEASEEGITVSGFKDIVVDTESSDGSSNDFEVYNLREIGESLVEAANSTFYKENDSPVFNEVVATSVTVKDAVTDNISVSNAITLGSTPIFIDNDNFLTIGDTEQEN